MVELFKHIIHLDFEWLFSTYNTAVYFILFLVIFIETGLVIMPFLPGDSLLFTAGLFANQLNATTGEPYLNLTYLLILLFIAAIIGDTINYWIGRKLGLKLIVQLKFRGEKLIKQEYFWIKRMSFMKNMDLKPSYLRVLFLLLEHLLPLLVEWQRWIIKSFLLTI